MNTMFSSRKKKEKTQVIQLSETELDHTTVTELIMPETHGKGIPMLKANFNAVLRDQAIFYPVAYKFIRMLGKGRQGIVFLGERHGARGCVTRHAIKVFDPGIYPTAKKYWTDMGRLAEQISTMHSVNGPNLVNRDIYEEVSGIGYIQMEVIDGINLHDLLHGNILEDVRKNSSEDEWAHFNDVIFRQIDGKFCVQPGVALYIMRQVLIGLETLHNRGFLHADVKPGNIMLNRLGYVKIIDFGRAVRVNEPMAVLLGSPMYMAPEVHRREAFLIESDLFSVGLVGLELLRGETLMPARGRKESELLNTKMKLIDNLPRLLPDHVRQNKDLVHIFQRFLDPNPANRFHSAEEAEAGELSLRLVHNQLTKSDQEAEYGRELSRFMAKITQPSIR